MIINPYYPPEQPQIGKTMSAPGQRRRKKRNHGGISWSSYWTTRLPYFALPATGVSLMVGQEVTIYGDELVSLPIGADLTVTYTCDIGSASGNNYTINPIAGNIGDHSIRIVCVSNGITRVDETIAISVYAENLTGTKKVLMVGDSTLDGDIEFIGAETDAILNNNTFTYIGTQGTTRKHEGYAGYDWNTFVTAGSPFFKAGVIDVPAYFTDNSIDTPDIVYFRLGVNNAHGYSASDMSAAELLVIQGWIDSLVDAFLAFNADLRIILALPTSTGSTAAAWNTDYDESIYKQDKYIEIIQRMRKAMTVRYANGLYNIRVDCSYEQIFLNRATGFLNGVHINTAVGDVMLGDGLALALNKDITYGRALNVINDGDTWGWYDLRDTTTITNDGGGLISLLKDKLLSGLDLIAAGAARPILGADGLHFDGVANEMKTAGGSIFQPIKIYLVLRQDVWTSAAHIIDGRTGAGRMSLIQHTASPGLQLYGSSGTDDNNDCSVGAFHLLVLLFSGASSSIQVDANAATNGNAGTAGSNGITWGAYAGDSNFSHVTFKEAIYRTVADGAGDTGYIMAYLKAKYGL